MDGEERERKMIEDQIARARAAVGADETPKALERLEGEKVKLSLSLSLAPKTSEEPKSEGEGTPAPPQPDAAPVNKISFGAIGSTGKTAIANPLKRPAPVNVFKSAKSAKTEEAPKAKAFVSEAERLMKEDQARKASRGGGYQGAGPRRGDVRRY